MNILRLKNPIQNYAWGSHTAIAAVLGLPPSAEPQAELWMSAHPRASSEVWVEGEWLPLVEVIENSPETMLGVADLPAGSARQQLPFLLKILAAEHPLSIQAHPNLEQATAGFAREDGLSLDIASPTRNYRDANHKPEILYALTPFTVLRGFRPQAEARKLLAAAGLDDLLGTGPTAWKDFLGAYFQLSSGRVDNAWRQVQQISGLDPLVEEWLGRLAIAYPGDRGVLAPLFLQLFTLEPDQALYTGPGVLHAYLEGLGVELMANSDNVLRGGLTAKHVDANELLAIVSPETVEPTPLEPRVSGSGDRSVSRQFRAPLGDLDLTEVQIGARSDVRLSGEHPRMLLCLKGQGQVRAEVPGAEPLNFHHGDSFFIPATVHSVTVSGEVRVFVAGATL